jgi:hypothetical protein
VSYRHESNMRASYSSAVANRAEGLRVGNCLVIHGGLDSGPRIRRSGLLACIPGLFHVPLIPILMGIVTIFE